MLSRVKVSGGFGEIGSLAPSMRCETAGRLSLVLVCRADSYVCWSPGYYRGCIGRREQAAPRRISGTFSGLGPQRDCMAAQGRYKNRRTISRQRKALCNPRIEAEGGTGRAGGSYELVPYIDRGIAPPETSWQFHLTDPASLPHLNQQVATWGIGGDVESWLRNYGVTTVPVKNADRDKRHLILVGDVAEHFSQVEWNELAARMATGSTAIFLAPQAFKNGKDGGERLPLQNKGQVYSFNDFLYHKECVGKHHPVFEGLQGQGLLDWYYYGPVLPHYVFSGQDTPAEIMAVAFAAGYSTAGGYASGVLLGSYRFGAGKFIVNSFGILENIDKHPAADRLLLNLIQFGNTSSSEAPAPLPSDFQRMLKAIGYAE